jgi:7-carboxy-7-deazaguanine synthase
MHKLQEEVSLKITEIFYSLQGETNTVGLPTVFVRLTGCPLRCVYCDTTYSFKGGQRLSIADIIAQVQQYKTRYVTVTGGEPLAQENCLILLKELCDLGYNVSLETSGALDVQAVDARVTKIIDLKTPSSGEQDKNRYTNLLYADAKDQIKFVIGDRQDYEWSKKILNEYQLAQTTQVLFSPIYQTIHAKEIADWILEDELPVRLQIQLHKYLWGETPGK